MSQVHDPLDPDDEQKVFEILSMGEEGHAALQNIREYMKFIVKQENGCYNADTRPNQRTTGNDAGESQGTPGS